jgi:hypothetical protein
MRVRPPSVKRRGARTGVQLFASSERTCYAGRPKRKAHRITRIAVAFEAGHDGFWLARWLAVQGIEAHVIHASSVKNGSTTSEPRRRCACTHHGSGHCDPARSAACALTPRSTSCASMGHPRSAADTIARAHCSLCRRNVVRQNHTAGLVKLVGLSEPGGRCGEPDGEIPWNGLSRISDDEMR